MAQDWTPRGYVLEDLLGSGGSADVWRARVAATGDPVALKRVRIDGLGEVGAQRMQQAGDEARLLASLDHPSIVRLHALERTRDSLVLVLDLADRGSLRDLLAARGRLSPGEVITALAPVAAAVAHLHERSIVHGDVSAANVLFTRDGAPLLSDVGVARMVGDDRIVQSTPIYVDPAVAAGRAPTTSSDVFMLGAVAVHALTGEPLWRAGNGPIAALARAVGGVPRDLADQLRGAGVPEAMVEVLGRALLNDPDARCTAVEFALDLRHSATPVAVEFTAGRVTPEPGPARHADGADGDDGEPVDERPPASPGVRTLHVGRPEFQRPGPAPAQPAEPPTRLVHPRQRPRVPERSGRFRRPARRTERVPGRHRVPTTAPRTLRPGSARLAAPAAIGTVLAVTAAVVVLFSQGGRGSSAAGAPNTATPNTATPKTATLKTVAPKTATHEVTTAGVNTAGVNTPEGGQVRQTPSSRSVKPRTVDWRRVLVGLDATRARAYAARDPALLRRVYLPGRLLDGDVDRMLATVPHGCGLHDAATDYRLVSVRGTAQRATLIVDAQLSASRLLCAGQVRGTAAGTGTTRLQVELVRTDRGPLIAAEQPL